jgi:ABC-type lipoprotein export system ATPase subunit
MTSPELALADEPTGHLDRASAVLVLDLIGRSTGMKGRHF